MRIEIIYEDGKKIIVFDLESNPFKVGETINIKVLNYNIEFWKYVKKINDEFVIQKIEHFVRNEYKADKTSKTILPYQLKC